MDYRLCTETLVSLSRPCRSHCNWRRPDRARRGSRSRPGARASLRHRRARLVRALYVFVFRGTPLLVQIFLIYYGLSQFGAVRHSIFWPVLREPYWCAVLALTPEYGGLCERIIRGGLLSVPHGQVEAARACGMPRLMIFRRIVMPLAIRQALPGYSNEMISMVKATSLASIITLMEITGVAAKIISETYRAIEVFVVAGAIYLAINFLLTRPHPSRRIPAEPASAPAGCPLSGS